MGDPTLCAYGKQQFNIVGYHTDTHAKHIKLGKKGIGEFEGETEGRVDNPISLYSYGKLSKIKICHKKCIILRLKIQEAMKTNVCREVGT